MTQDTFTMDTSVILSICYDYEKEKFAKCLRNENNFVNTTILLNPMIKMEMKRHGFNHKNVKKMLYDALGSHIKIIYAKDDVSEIVKRMTAQHPDLHPGDDEILAYAVKYNTVLITCDKGLAQVAKQERVEVINPDIINATKLHELKHQTQHDSKKRRRISVTSWARKSMKRQHELQTTKDSRQNTARQLLEMQQKNKKEKEKKQAKSRLAKQMRLDHQKQLAKLSEQSSSEYTD